MVDYSIFIHNMSIISLSISFIEMIFNCDIKIRAIPVEIKVLSFVKTLYLGIIYIIRLIRFNKPFNVKMMILALKIIIVNAAIGVKIVGNKSAQPTHQLKLEILA